MRAVILAAGYATRMYPLTKTRPKSLLPVGKRVVLDWMMASLHGLPELTEIALVTNAKFAAQFDAWIRLRAFRVPVRLINDGSASDEQRLGAIRDLTLAIGQAPAQEPLLVTAGDHIVDWDLQSLCAFGQAHAPHATVAAYRLPDLTEASRFGIVEMDGAQRLIHCEEKPRRPRSGMAMICLYYLPTAVFPRLRQYLALGRNTDAPGNFIAWLSQQEPVYGWPTQGAYFDIGTLESYDATCAALTERAAASKTHRGGAA